MRAKKEIGSRTRRKENEQDGQQIRISSYSRARLLYFTLVKTVADVAFSQFRRGGNIDNTTNARSETAHAVGIACVQPPLPLRKNPKGVGCCKGATWKHCCGQKKKLFSGISREFSHPKVVIPKKNSYHNEVFKFGH